MNTFPPFFEGLFDKQFGSWFTVLALHNQGADLSFLALDIEHSLELVATLFYDETGENCASTSYTVCETLYDVKDCVRIGILRSWVGYTVALATYVDDGRSFATFLIGD